MFVPSFFIVRLTKADIYYLGGDTSTNLTNDEEDSLAIHANQSLKICSCGVGLRGTHGQIDVFLTDKSTRLGTIEWDSPDSGDNYLRVPQETVATGWSWNVPDVPAKGALGDVTVTFNQAR